MTIICTEEQKKIIINAQFCPFGDCPFYSKEHGAKYETCKQCREDNIEWKEEKLKGEWILISGSLKCPFCGFRDYRKTIYNYCSVCGADMRGEEK